MDSANWTSKANDDRIGDGASFDDVTPAKDARTEFIMGSKSFDEWDSYVSAIENMGLDTMLEIYQAASDRFDALNNK